MSAHRLSFLFMTSLACLSGAAHAQGPWPTMNQPTFFSPVQEFFTPRSYTSNYNPPMYSQYPATPINPGVPQSANGRSRQTCPNGQCTTSNRCANGQCAPNSNCANGQCGPGMGSWSNGGYGTSGTTRSGMSNSTIGFRPLTPVNPNDSAPRSGNLNRLIPLEGGTPVNSGYNAPQGPMYRDRESMVPQGYDYRHDPGVRLQ